MGLKQAREGWKQSQAVEEAKREVRDITQQLGTALMEVKDRNDRITANLKQVNEMWLSIESPSEGGLHEFMSLRTEFNRSLEALVEGVAQTEKLHEISQEIARTPKTNFNDLLELYSQIVAICRSRLELEIPERAIVCAWREQQIEKMRVLAEEEIVRAAN